MNSLRLSREADILSAVDSRHDIQLGPDINRYISRALVMANSKTSVPALFPASKP